MLIPAGSAFSQGFATLGGGVAGWIYATIVYNGQLIAAGDCPGHIARWDGAVWQPLGTGLDGRVNALAVYQGNLYAGGQFFTAGGVPVSCIAYWNGAGWNDPEGGVGNIVASLTVYGGQLIVGGYFTSADGSPGNYIARWDGNGWNVLGTGMGGTQGQVMALTVWNNQLIAGGFFDTAGGNPAPHIAAWNGSAWSSIGGGIGWIVYALTPYNGNLIAGGLFSSAGGNPAQDVARWNGSTWAEVGNGGIGGGVYGYVLALTVVGNELIAGGMFEHAGGNPAMNIAGWNGSSWAPLGSGMSNSGSTTAVCALTPFGTGFAAGGIFTAGDAVGSANIIAWNGPVPHVSLQPITDLTAIPLGGNIVLRWSRMGNPAFHVYTDAAVNGTYTTLVTATTDTFATVSSPAAAQGFYVVKGADAP
ncbi:MAG TPA: hypothetical protein VGL38_15700 [bacterium]|jgi:hypothetical protein